MKKNIVFALALLSITAQANIRLPKILSDNMVIQRNKPITLWGWADPNEKVTIQFKQQSKSVKASSLGKWIVTLSPEIAGGPFQLIFKGKNTIKLAGILIGEVWVCSGQSNMEWLLSNSNNAEQEIKEANYPEIRQFLVQKNVSLNAEEDVKGGDWKICSPASAGNFTAVGYFFARELYNKLKIPIGLINSSWGGTHSETWTSREAFEQSADFKDMITSLPKVDIENLSKKKFEAFTKKLKTLNISLPAVGVEKWKNLEFDDSQWNTMALPGYWEQQNLENMDGVVWFRKKITISKTDAGKEAKLNLSMIDDADESYINGVKIGTTQGYNLKRSYKVPAGILKEGENVIVIRVEDTGGGGGVYGDTSDLNLTTQSNTAISLVGNWLFNIESMLGGAPSVGPNDYPTLLFNAMIYPLTNFAIQGAIWYQGESNTGRSIQYRTAFPLMISDWRKHWNLGDFPFYYVQLASFNANNGNSEQGSGWAELREAQAMTLSLPNTGMAVTTDIGEAKDIHPRNKQDVGKRLASIALNKVYGSNNIFSGPVYQSMRVDGNKIRVLFTQTGSGLLAKDKYGYIKGFEIADSSQKFHYAKAYIEGNEVIVSCDAVVSPVAVRYAWADYPGDANLFNNEGFPASSFRTDTWKAVTSEGKFSFN